jgi:hypothetical protein
MWYPPGPDEPMRELREALDAVHGTGRPDDSDPIVLISPDLGRWRDLAARVKWVSRRVPAPVGTLFILTLAGVLVALISAALPGH